MVADEANDARAHLVAFCLFRGPTWKKSAACRGEPRLQAAWEQRVRESVEVASQPASWASAASDASDARGKRGKRQEAWGPAVSGGAETARVTVHRTRRLVTRDPLLAVRPLFAVRRRVSRAQTTEPNATPTPQGHAHPESAHANIASTTAPGCSSQGIARHRFGDWESVSVTETRRRAEMGIRAQIPRVRLGPAGAGGGAATAVTAADCCQGAFDSRPPRRGWEKGEKRVVVVVGRRCDALALEMPDGDRRFIQRPFRHAPASQPRLALATAARFRLGFICTRRRRSEPPQITTA